MGKAKFEGDLNYKAYKGKANTSVIKNKVRYAAKDFRDKVEKIYDYLEADYKNEKLKVKLKK